MEGQSNFGPLPVAALSLQAFGPNVVAAPRPCKPRQVSIPSSVPGARDGPRSHPIAALLPADVAQAESRSTERTRSQPNSIARLVAAVPAALGRLLVKPMPQAPFTSSVRLSDARVFPSAVRKRAARGGGARPVGGAGRKAALVWFRNDLRLHDNPSLERACREGSSVLPVYVFDPRDYGKTPSGFDRTGPARARFILDAVSDLRARLRAAGSELVVRVGRPEEVLAGLARSVGAGAVFCQAEVTAEEAQVEGRVRAALERDGCELRPLWGGTLYHLEDLPFKLASMPTSYADFRFRVAGLAVRPLVESEGAVKGLPQGNSIEAGELPSLQQLGLSAAAAAAPAPGSGFGAPVLGAAGRAGPQLRGGESEALRHLQSFMEELKSSLSRTQQTAATLRKHPHSQSPAGPAAAATAAPASGASGGPGSSAFSCHISPWLALGCLSPRRMYHEMRQQLGGAAQIVTAPAKRQQPAGGADAGGAGPANWLVFELLWRDFFRFVTQKYADSNSATTRAAAAKSGVARSGATVTVSPAVAARHPVEAAPMALVAA